MPFAFTGRAPNRVSGANVFNTHLADALHAQGGGYRGVACECEVKRGG